MSANILLWCNILTPFVTSYNEHFATIRTEKKKKNFPCAVRTVPSHVLSQHVQILTAPGAPLTIGTFANRYRSLPKHGPTGLTDRFYARSAHFYFPHNRLYCALAQWICDGQVSYLARPVSNIATAS
ncbi:hypothetical protein BKA83DRAFT_3170721 [Pisolithus microcarpus]|nr:hypothetical protein BKA83DRAFT_3170721 [Pisolithus microcarpus]